MSYSRAEGTYKEQSQKPAIRGFQLGAGGVGRLKESVNHFRGDVNLPLTLVNLSSDSGEGIRVVAMYDSNIHASVSKWNMESQTSVLGLGWSLPISYITVNHVGTGAEYDDNYYLISGGESLPLTYLGGSDYYKDFFCPQYPLWKFQYQANDESWIVTKEDGSVDIYGGWDPRQTNIFWGNWTGASINSEGAKQVTSAWNLSARKTVWGTETTYSYINDEVPVYGTAEHCCFTRGSYLAEIHDSAGHKVTFHYESKEQHEYLPLHFIPKYEDLHAYQERHQTKYLSSIEVTANGKELYTLVFAYEAELFNYFADSVQWHDDPYLPYFGKRILKSITQQKSGKSMLPPMHFSYDLDKRTANPGALAAVTYPQGGSVQYTYEQKRWMPKNNDGDLFKKNLSIDCPLDAVSDPIPRVFIGADYVLILWFSGSQSALQIFQWGGHWSEPWMVTNLPGILPEDIEYIRVLIRDDYCVLYYNRSPDKGYIFHKQENQFGHWVRTDFTFTYSPNEFYPDIGYEPNKADTSLIGGDDFFVLHHVDNKWLTRVSYVPKEQTWLVESLDFELPNYDYPNSRPIAAGKRFFAAAKLSCHLREVSGYIVGFFRLTGIDIWYRDQENNWQTNYFDVYASDDFMWHPAILGMLVINETYGAFSYTTSNIYEAEPDEYKSRVIIFRLDRNFNAHSIAEFGNYEGWDLPVALGSTLYYGESIAFSYDGAEWKHTAISSNTAYGENQAVSSTYRYWYDPYEYPGGAWRENKHSQSNGSEIVPTIGGNFMTIGSNVYFKQPDNELVLLEPDILHDAHDNLIYNHGPNYIAFERDDDTVILLLKNGRLHGEPIIYKDQCIQPKEDVTYLGGILTGAKAFVTYDSNSDSANALTLHRILNHSLADEETDIVVSKLTIHNGYRSFAKSYEYDTFMAIFNTSGQVIQYPQVTVNILDSKGGSLGHTIYRFHNGLPLEEASGTNFNEFYSLFSGMLYKTAIYDAAGELISQTEETWEVVQLDRWRFKFDYPAIVPVNSKTKETTYNLTVLDADGSELPEPNGSVTRIVERTFTEETGLLKSQTIEIYNAMGEIETLREDILYAYEAGFNPHSDMFNAFAPNCLTYITQKTLLNVTTNEFISSEVTYYKEFSSEDDLVIGKWKTYQWLGPDSGAPIPDFTDGTYNDWVGWIKTQEVLNRNVRTGQVQAQSDELGVIQSTRYDLSGQYAVSKFINANIANSPYPEASYYGFEPYEVTLGWKPDKGTLNDLIHTADSHTGTQCLNISNHDIVSNNYSIPQAGRYLLTCWVKSSVALDQDDAGWQFREGSTEIDKFALPNTNGEWQHVYHYLTLSKDMTLNVRVYNHTQSIILVDNIFFAPVIGNFSAKVYDPQTMLQTAELGPKGETLRYLYDPLSRPIALTGPDECVATLKGRSYAQEAAMADWQTTPNASFQITCRGGGFVEEFRDGQWPETWLADNTKWVVDQQRLVYQGASGMLQYITLSEQPVYEQKGSRSAKRRRPDSKQKSKRASYRNAATAISYFGIRWTVGLESEGEIAEAFGLQLGESLTLQWQSGEWQLIQNSKVIVTSDVSLMPDSDCLLVVQGHSVLFYLNGQQILGHYFDQAIPDAQIALFTAQNSMSFSQILVFEDPIITMTYTNGANQVIQKQALDDLGVIAVGYLYDDRGNKAITTKAILYPSQVFGYQANLIESMDWDSGAMTGDVANYWDEDEGFPYSRHLFESSPLTRVVMSGQPGPTLSINSGDSHPIQYKYTTNSESFLPNLPASQYLCQVEIDPDGNQTQTLQDMLNRTIMTRRISADKSEILTTSYEYNSLQQRVVTKSPNYYAPPLNSVADDWLTIEQPDFLGRVLTVSSPNVGKVQCVYDRANQMRFILSQNGKGSGVDGLDRIIYFKYDALGRKCEDGYVETEWDREALEAKADKDWPVDCETWLHRWAYDGDGSRIQDLTHLTTVQTQQTQSIISETYSYDLAGNVIGKETIIDDETRHVKYGHDRVGNVTRLTYPHRVGEEAQARKVIYGYNALGRLHQVGQPGVGNEALYAALSYTADQKLQTETFGASDISLTRSYRYNSPGWLTEIDDGTYFSQQLSYEETLDAANQMVRRGNITMMKSQFKGAASSQSNFPDQQWKLAHSGANRLQIAAFEPDADQSIDSISFDANGNIIGVTQGDSAEEWAYYDGTDQVKNVIGIEQEDFSYDANGNLASAPDDKRQHLTYNLVSGRTETIRDAQEQTLQMQYGDGDQRLVKSIQVANSEVSRQTYWIGADEGSNPLTVQKSGISEQSEDYIYTPYGLLAKVANNTINYFIRDHLGSTRLVVDEQGEVIATFSYRPFGGDLEMPGGSNPQLVIYRYTGQEWDAEAETYYYKVRIYDPKLRRFYSPDPDNQFFSPYVYNGNNPLHMVDPSGRFAFLTALLIGAAIGAAVGVAAATVVVIKKDLHGWEAFGYIFASALVGAAFGAASAAGGFAVIEVGAVAAEAAVAQGATAAVGKLAGVAASAAVGAAIEGTIGTLSNMAQFGVASGFGVAEGTLGEAAKQGAIVGASLGAFTGGVAGYGAGKVMTSSNYDLSATHGRDWFTYDMDNFFHSRFVKKDLDLSPKYRYANEAFDYATRIGTWIIWIPIVTEFSTSI